MTLKEFRKRINLAEERLRTRRFFYSDPLLYNYKGVCDALLNVDIPIKHFRELFEPRNKLVYWIGELAEKNLPLRKLFLRLFERIAIDEKLYREY